MKNVSDGYARNFLIPRKLAMLATEAARKNIDSLKQKKETEDTHKKEAQAALVASLDGKKVTIAEKANEEGHLFAGITRERIATELGKMIGASVDASLIHLEHPIKQIGDHEITLHAAGKESKARVEVVKE